MSRPIPRHHGLLCPYCGSPTRVFSARTVGNTYRQKVIDCLNTDCAGRFGAEESITHVIHPGTRPDPSVHLRTTPPRRRAANDDHRAAETDQRGAEVPQPGNDDTPGAIAAG